MKSYKFTLRYLFSPFQLLGRTLRVFAALSFILLSSLFARWFFTSMFPPPQPVPQQTPQQILLDIFIVLSSCYFDIWQNTFYAAVRYVDDIYETNHFAMH